jgi:hypothetical protein
VSGNRPAGPLLEELLDAEEADAEELLADHRQKTRGSSASESVTSRSPRPGSAPEQSESGRGARVTTCQAARAAAGAAWLAAHRAYQHTCVPGLSSEELHAAIAEWRAANREWKLALEDWHRLLDAGGG